jgi:hypothetical protein
MNGVGCKGRVSHLKRRYGMRRFRLKARDAEPWPPGTIVAHSLDTLPSETPGRIPTGRILPETTRPNGRVSARARPFLVLNPII